MMNLSRWKIGLVLVAILGGILFSLPNFLPQSTRDSVKSFLPMQTLNLGLDLQGGSYLLMEVDTDALKAQKANQLLEDVRDHLKDAQIAGTNLAVNGTTVSVRITDPNQVNAAFASLAKLATPLQKSPGLMDIAVSRGQDQTLQLTLSDAGLNADAASAVDTSLEIVRRRIDNMGTKEPSIVRQGANRIVIEAPGESDPEELKRVIGQTANLTFQMVDETASQADIAAGRDSAGLATAAL